MGGAGIGTRGGTLGRGLWRVIEEGIQGGAGGVDGARQAEGEEEQYVDGMGLARAMAAEGVEEERADQTATPCRPVALRTTAVVAALRDNPTPHLLNPSIQAGPRRKNASPVVAVEEQRCFRGRKSHLIKSGLQLHGPGRPCFTLRRVSLFQYISY